MPATLVHVENAVCRISRNRTLRIDDFRIRPGEHHCAFGGNGAGKSLLGALIRGELVTGRAHVHYREHFEPRRDIRIVSFEEQRRLQDLDRRHDISEFSASAADAGTTVAALVLGGREPDPAYYRLLESLQIDELEQRGIRYLSSGQLRRAMMARALYQEPTLLIMDEPLESIDHQSRHSISRTLSRWVTSATASLLLCRRAQDILPFVTHLALMDELTIREQGPIDVVRQSCVYRELVHEPLPVPERLPGPPPGAAQPELPAGMPLIELRDVQARWGEQTVFRNVNWRFEQGHNAWIRGPNGCGKSTLLGLISGENHKAYGQSVTLFGRRRGSGESVWQIKARFGIVSNELHGAYIRGWRVRDVVVSGLYDSIGLYDRTRASERELAGAWLTALSLGAVADHGFHELSFGQQRLVLLARAMIKYPAILVLDEPCVGLDDRYRRLIPELVDRIVEQTPVQVLYVTHDVNEEMPRCINQHLSFLPDAEDGWRIRVDTP